MFNNTIIINGLANKGFKNVTAKKITKNGVKLNAFIYTVDNIGVTVYTDGCKTNDDVINRCADAFSRPIPEIDNPLKNFDKSKLNARIYARGKSGSDIARPFLNLEIVPCYDVIIDEINGEGGQIKLNHATASTITNMDVNDLIDTAIKNAFTQVTVNHIADMLSRMSGQPREAFEGVPMWVISNTHKTYGAVNLANTVELGNLADKLNEDIYVLPSSLHELIAVPVSLGEPSMFLEMVREINATEVKAEEKLSDSVYIYSRKNNTVTLA